MVDRTNPTQPRSNHDHPRTSSIKPLSPPAPGPAITAEPHHRLQSSSQPTARPPRRCLSARNLHEPDFTQVLIDHTASSSGKPSSSAPPASPPNTTCRRRRPRQLRHTTNQVAPTLSGTSSFHLVDATVTKKTRSRSSPPNPNRRLAYKGRSRLDVVMKPLTH